MRLGYNDEDVCEDIMAADGIENLAVLLHAQESSLRWVMCPLTIITSAGLLELQATYCEVVIFLHSLDIRTAVCSVILLAMAPSENGNRTVCPPEWNYAVEAFQHQVHE